MSEQHFFDNHCHLDDEKFNDDREAIIDEIYNNGITKLISAGYNVESSKMALELTKKYDFIYSTAGISPNDIPQTESELWKMLDEIKNIAKTSKKVVAIGEIGLDYYWSSDNKDFQKLCFIKQIELANELNLPIVIHSRKAQEDTLQILKEFCVNRKGVFHCCALNNGFLKTAIDLGFYFSFAGPITFKNSKNVEDVINAIPNSRLLIETDSPYLSPEPFRGTRNDSRNVKLVAQKIADIKNMSLDEIANLTFKNAEKIYNI